MAEVSFLPAAESDYIDALDWYAERSERAAVRFEAAIDVAVRSIAAAPERWPLIDARHRVYILRRFPYSIVYRNEPAFVLVVAVAHSRRSATFWHDRE